MARSDSGRIEAAVAATAASLFGLASLIQFGMVEMTVTYPNYEVTPLASMAGGLVGYVVALVTPMAKRFDRLQGWEIVLVIAVPFSLLLHGLSTTVQDLVATSPLVGGVLWMICAVTVGVFLR